MHVLYCSAYLFLCNVPSMFKCQLLNVKKNSVSFGMQYRENNSQKKKQNKTKQKKKNNPVSPGLLWFKIWSGVAG